MVLYNLGLTGSLNSSLNQGWYFNSFLVEIFCQRRLSMSYSAMLNQHLFMVIHYGSSYLGNKTWKHTLENPSINLETSAITWKHHYENMLPS